MVKRKILLQKGKKTTLVIGILIKIFLPLVDLQQHGIYEGDSTFQQLLRRIVRYLEELTRRTTRHAQPTW